MLLSRPNLAPRGEVQFLSEPADSLSEESGESCIKVAGSWKNTLSGTSTAIHIDESTRSASAQHVSAAAAFLHCLADPKNPTS